MADNGKRKKMSSGHDAGMQSGSQFGEIEKKIKAGRDAEMNSLDAKLSGANAETTFRDKRGKKLDMLSEFMRQTAVEEGKASKIEEAQYKWGKGAVQVESAEQAQKEMDLIAAEPFARTVNDPRLEKAKKELIRDGDPMAAYFASKAADEEEECEESHPVANIVTSTKPAKKMKPKYSGPTPPPNRFNIRPGYRWDAIDRGNAFEKKLLTMSNERQSNREDQYQWSVSDM